jgi:hypothetical protein
MKVIMLISLFAVFGVINAAEPEAFNPDVFAQDYFKAWTATQNPKASKENIEHYLSFLTDDVGHQHYPYDPDDERHPDNKERMREGMNYYLGATTEYSGELLSHNFGHNVVVIKYKTSSKGVHPQTKQTVSQHKLTLEVLETEDDKVSVIRKYSD